MSEDLKKNLELSLNNAKRLSNKILINGNLTSAKSSNKIKVTTKDDYYLTINKKDISHLTISLDYKGPILAPVKKGSQIATMTIMKKDQTIKSLPLYSIEDLKKVNFFKSLITSLNYLIWGDV